MPLYDSIDKEEQLIVTLALFILAQLGEKHPQKRKVLRFIKSRQLCNFYDGDHEQRSNGEEKWMNDFSWAREDMRESGDIEMPERGIWRLTENGHGAIIARARKWNTNFLEFPESRQEFLSRCRRINDNVFRHMIMLGRGMDISRVPQASL